MTKRPALIWLTFFLFLALALGATGWMTRTVLRLDQAQARATAAAQLEENVRLALWRMDGAIALSQNATKIMWASVSMPACSPDGLLWRCRHVRDGATRGRPA